MNVVAAVAAPPQDNASKKQATGSPRPMSRTQLLPHHLVFGAPDRGEHPTGRELFGHKNFKTVPGLAANGALHIHSHNLATDSILIAARTARASVQYLRPGALNGLNRGAKCRQIF